MSSEPPLYLFEEITLLALRDEKGTPLIANLPQALAGSLLATLALRDRIAVEEGRKPFVTLLDPSPTGHPLLDECLEKLASAKRRASLSTWLSRFASIKRLREKAAQGLCQKGILKHEEKTLLFVFTHKVFPEIDPKPERELIERLRQAIFSDYHVVDPRDAVVLSLADASGLLDRIFGRKALKPRRKRIKSIVQGELLGKATRQSIAACQAALVASAVVVPAVVASG